MIVKYMSLGMNRMVLIQNVCTLRKNENNFTMLTSSSRKIMTNVYVIKLMIGDTKYTIKSIRRMWLIHGIHIWSRNTTISTTVEKGILFILPCRTFKFTLRDIPPTMSFGWITFLIKKAITTITGCQWIIIIRNSTSSILNLNIIHINIITTSE